MTERRTGSRAFESLAERAERIAAEHARRNAAAMRRAFWTSKAEAALVEPGVGILEQRAAMAREAEAAALSRAQADWHARYMAARPPLRLIQGGRA